MTNVADEVFSILKKRAPNGRTEFELTDKLDDLGLESLDTIEMIFDIEEKFDIQIPYSANSAKPEFETIGDVVKAIENLVETRP